MAATSTRRCRSRAAGTSGGGSGRSTGCACASMGSRKRFARSAEGRRYASTAVNVTIARSAEGHRYASTVADVTCARSAEARRYASMVANASSARSAEARRYASIPFCRCRDTPGDTRAQARDLGSPAVAPTYGYEACGLVGRYIYSSEPGERRVRFIWSTDDARGDLTLGDTAFPCAFQLTLSPCRTRVRVRASGQRRARLLRTKSLRLVPVAFMN